MEPSSLHRLNGRPLRGEDMLQVYYPQLARVCELLGAEHINIEYAYSGLDSNNAPVVFFGVKDAGKAAMVLDKIAVAA